MRYLILLAMFPILALAEQSLYLGGYNITTSKLETESDVVGVGYLHSLNDRVSVNLFYGEEVRTRRGDPIFSMETLQLKNGPLTRERVDYPKLKTNNMIKTGFVIEQPVKGDLSAYVGAEWVDIGDHQEVGWSAGGKLQVDGLLFRFEYFDAGSGVHGYGFNLGKKI